MGTLSTLPKSNQMHEFVGYHVLGELHGVDFEKLNDACLLIEALEAGIIASGATLCSLQEKTFDPHGVTVLCLLSESHASVHTYPELGALFFDAFTCGHTCQPQKIAESLAERLSAESVSIKTLVRGLPSTSA